MIHKVFRISTNYEKEENWINHMASMGMNFVGYTPFVFMFQDGEPGEYIYRIELLDHKPCHPESKAYIDFMEESGVELVDSHYRWAYFRKKTADGAFDIFSDYTSRIKHYIRIFKLLIVVCGFNLLWAIVNIMLFIFLHALPLNLYAGILNLAVAIATGLPAINTYRRMKKLKQEKTIYE